MKRAIKFIGTDRELVLSASIALDISKVPDMHKEQLPFLDLDELPDGTWRMTRFKHWIPDFTKVTRITFYGLEKGIPREKPLRNVYFVIEGGNMKLPLSKVVPISGNNAPGMIRLHENADKTWSLLFSKDLFSEFSQIPSWQMIRED